jgi:putative heme-binding domain-containing protein
MAALTSGTAMPARLLGSFLCVDPLHHNVIAAERRVHGSTFETTDIGVPLRSPDLTFRPVFLCNSPDGSMVIADFCEEFIAHGQNYQGQIDPSSGRIYRLRGRGRTLVSDYNLEAKSSAELVQLLDHPNLWHRQTAARLLGQRGDSASVPALLAALAKPAAHPAIDALWALHQMGELDGAIAVRALGHPAPLVRSWAVRLTGDANKLGPRFIAALTSSAQIEQSAELRCQILSTARRLGTDEALQLIQDIQFPEIDADDPFIPLMMWSVIESHCAERAEDILAMFEQEEFWSRPIIRSHIVPRLMRRFAEAGSRKDLLTCSKLLDLAPTAGDRARLLAGFEQAFEGRIPPVFPDELLARLGERSISMQIRQGDPDAITRALAALQNPATPRAQRLSAIRAFGTAPRTEAAPILMNILRDSEREDLETQAAVLSALQTYDLDQIASLADLIAAMDPAMRPRAINLLASRASWSLKLLKSESLPDLDITPELIARMRLHGSEELSALLDQQFPRSDHRASSPSAEAIRAILAAGSGDPYRGETIYSARCGSCHRLFFKGGSVGPDLTRYQRDDLGTMLNSILDPNAEIREGYENYIASTKDGRILSGFLADQDANTVVLRGFDGADTTLERTNLRELSSAGRSLMPEGLLNGLDDQQLRDLFGYLKISQPITK